jgi:hypothetical protein
MTQTKEYTVYTFEELDEKAKHRARNWWRESVFSDPCDWDYVIEDACTMGALMGIDIDNREWANKYGYSGSTPKVYFSGFSSQGDGACFEGAYRYKEGAVNAIKAERNDSELLRIAKALQECQRKQFYKLRATMRHSGHYNHSGCMSVDVVHYDDDYRDIRDAEEEVRQLMRDFADWIYSQLEKEYDYQMSDDDVDESLICNEYTFDIDGNRKD